MVKDLKPWQFKKGHKVNNGRKPWNKDTKGLQVAWNKGKREAPPRTNEYYRNYYMTDKDGSRRRRMKSKYGLEWDDYQKMLLSQTGLCKICKSPQNNSRADVLHIDHDHKTGKIRGLLCHKCNSALGYANDNPEILKEMIKYLQE